MGGEEGGTVISTRFAPELNRWKFIWGENCAASDRGGRFSDCNDTEKACDKEKKSWVYTIEGERYRKTP